MANQEKITTHIQLLQDVINRMASNSSAAKTWCITIVSAILVLAADKGKADIFLLAFIPILMFAMIDTYYLALEKGFRNSYNDFIQKVNTDSLEGFSFYRISICGDIIELRVESLKSFSISCFYTPLALTVVLAFIFF